jgi:ribosome modulation factor
MADNDVALMKSIFNKGYKACVRGDPKLAPYGQLTDKAVEWRRGYDEARKKRMKKVTTEKFDMGKQVSSPNPSTHTKKMKKDGWQKEDKVGRKTTSPNPTVSAKTDLWGEGEVDGSDLRDKAL